MAAPRHAVHFVLVSWLAFGCSSDGAASAPVGLPANGGAPVAGQGNASGGGTPVVGSGGAIANGGSAVGLGNGGATIGVAGAGGGSGGNVPVGGGTGGDVAGNGGTGGISGSGGVAGVAGIAGTGGTAGSGGAKEDECGPIPTGPKERATPKRAVLYGLVEYHTTEPNEFIGVHATLTVPAKPPPSGIIFAWPGTQAMADSKTYQPVAGGVLQPVLTWGQSCVPGALPGHSTWWISPVYVNDETSIGDLRGCHGGSVITVDVGDQLDLDMRLDGTNWNQTVVDTNSKKSTDFRIDLRGQQQQRVLFWIELKTSAKPTEDVIFEHAVLTMRSPEPGACALNNGGMNDYVSKSRVSADGLRCCIDRITLRAEGVPASSPDP